MTEHQPEAELLPLPLRIDGHCFGCSSGNAAGLQMQFFTTGNLVVSRLTVAPHLCGWANLVHGGILSTILDETMGWTAIYFLRRLVLTKNMTVHFLRPVFTGQPLRAEGHIVQRLDERLATVRAVLFNEQGKEAASADGTFSLFTVEAARKLSFWDDDLLDDIAAKFLTA